MSDDTNPKFKVSTPETATADLIDSIRKDIQDLDNAQAIAVGCNLPPGLSAPITSATSGAMCTLTLLAQMLEDGFLVNRAMTLPRIRHPEEGT